MTTSVEIKNTGLLSLTTGRLHGGIDDLYEAIEQLTGFACMTHHLIAIVRVLPEMLRERLPEPHWVEHYDPHAAGTTAVAPFSAEERADFMRRFADENKETLAQIGSKMVAVVV